jgi:hypothetical protein
MKKLITLILLMGSLSVMGCKGHISIGEGDDTTMVIKKIKSFKLNPTDVFYFGYSNQKIDRFTVIDTNSLGVFTAIRGDVVF